MNITSYDCNLVAQAKKKTTWAKVSYNEIELVQSVLLSQAPRLIHAFTTRHGGKSQPPIASFNLGRHRQDEASKLDAIANRQSLAKALGIDYESFVVPGQVHSSTVLVPEEIKSQDELKECDALITAAINKPLLLHFADCVPIILYDTKSHAISVIHAGWKGTRSGIAAKAANLMMAKYKSDPASIWAAIGPAICSQCYPTGEDVANELANSVKGAEALIELKSPPGSGQSQPHPDLKAINALQLLSLGLEQVDVTNLCTHCLPEMFYSHRYNQGQTGRQGAIACLQL